jgi:hypothetical protein
MQKQEMLLNSKANALMHMLLLRKLPEQGCHGHCETTRRRGLSVGGARYTPTLGQLGVYRRAQNPQPKVIALTGSSGKPINQSQKC